MNEWTNEWNKWKEWNKWNEWKEERSEWINEWMNKWNKRNEWMEYLINGMNGMNGRKEWMDEWMKAEWMKTEWMNEWMEWLNEWKEGRSEWMNKWMNGWIEWEGRKEGVSQWMNKSLIDWMKWLIGWSIDGLIDWLNEWMNESINQWCKLHLPKVPWHLQFFFFFFLWNRALARVSCTFCWPHFPKQLRRPHDLRFLRKIKLWLQSYFGDRWNHFTPKNIKKQGLCPNVFSSLNSRVPELCTSQLLDDDVVDIMVRTLTMTIASNSDVFELNFLW